MLAQLVAKDERRARASSEAGSSSCCYLLATVERHRRSRRRLCSDRSDGGEQALANKITFHDGARFTPAHSILLFAFINLFEVRGRRCNLQALRYLYHNFVKISSGTARPQRKLPVSIAGFGRLVVS